MNDCRRLKKDLALAAAEDARLPGPLSEHIQHCAGCRRYWRGMSLLRWQAEAERQTVSFPVDHTGFHERLAQRILSPGPAPASSLLHRFAAFRLRLAFAAAASAGAAFLGWHLLQPARPPAAVGLARPVAAPASSAAPPAQHSLLQYRLAANESPQAVESLLTRETDAFRTSFATVRAASRDFPE